MLCCSMRSGSRFLVRTYGECENACFYACSPRSLRSCRLDVLALYAQLSVVVLYLTQYNSSDSIGRRQMREQRTV